jgi:outer membrane protein TolC
MRKVLSAAARTWCALSNDQAEMHPVAPFGRGDYFPGPRRRPRIHSPLLAEGAVRSSQNFLDRRHVRTTGRGAVLLLAASAAAAGAAQAQPRITLERVVGLAAQRNERARISAAQADAAAGRVQRARAFFFPELTLSGAYTRRLHETVRNVGDGRVTISRRDALSAQANLTVPLFDARLFPLYRQAKLEGESASLAAAAERRLLGYEAADAFLMVLSQQHVVDAATQRLEFSRVTLEDARARADAGFVSSNDVTRSELESATAEREIATARASAATSRLELGYLVDTEMDGELATPDALLAAASRPPPPAAELIGAGLRHRFDLQSGKARVMALQAAASEPWRRIIPSLNGVAQYRVTNEQGFSGRAGDGFAGLTALWQLFDGGERYGEQAEREALARAGAAEQDARVRSVALEVRRALVSLESAQSTQRVAVTAREIARRNVAETSALYREGLGGTLAVADANLRLFEAEVALARERYALALAFLGLRAAAGEDPPGAGGQPGGQP